MVKPAPLDALAVQRREALEEPLARLAREHLPVPVHGDLAPQSLVAAATRRPRPPALAVRQRAHDAALALVRIAQATQQSPAALGRRACGCWLVPVLPRRRLAGRRGHSRRLGRRYLPTRVGPGGIVHSHEEPQVKGATRLLLVAGEGGIEYRQVCVNGRRAAPLAQRAHEAERGLLHARLRLTQHQLQLRRPKAHTEASVDRARLPAAVCVRVRVAAAAAASASASALAAAAGTGGVGGRLLQHAAREAAEHHDACGAVDARELRGEVAAQEGPLEEQQPRVEGGDFVGEQQQPLEALESVVAQAIQQPHQP